MGKSKKEVEDEPIVVDKKAVKDAKRNAKKEVKQALKALHLSHEAPAYVSASDCDALLLGLGLPLSKLVHLNIEFDERGQLERGSLYSKTKAAHRFIHDEPVISFDDEEEHTVVMFDPDAPERDGDGSTVGKRAPWLHYLGTGIKGSTGPSTKVVTEWLCPSPALGAHRYIWLAFKGSMKDSKKNDARICWSLSKFMEDNPNLKPFAFNFMYVMAN